MAAIYELLLTLFEPRTLLIFVLVLSRVSGLVLAAPIFGGQDVPMRIRALLALALALVCLPTQWRTELEMPRALADAAVLIAHELAVGLAIGAGLRILFTALQLAGQAISQTAGLSLSEIFNPAMGGSVSSISLLLHWLALAIFLLLGGQRLLLDGLLETFRTLPPGRSPVVLLAPEALSALLAHSFEIGLRVGAPCMLVLVLATLATALIGRTVPQLNMTLGLGVNSLLVLGTLTLTLGAAAWTWSDAVEPSVEMVFALFAGGEE